MEESYYKTIQAWPKSKIKNDEFDSLSIIFVLFDEVTLATSPWLDTINTLQVLFKTLKKIFNTHCFFS